MAEAKTKPTKVGVKDFIAKVANETRRKDAETLVKLFEKVTGWKAQMWGPTIVGFGAYDYVYDSGTKGSMCVVGFSPRASSLSIYSGIYPDEPPAAAILKQLGKYTRGKGCVYINKLEDIDLGQFENLIKTGVANTKQKTKEKGWPLRAA
jgi:Domain of unknown function (DU1801)